MPLPDVPDVPIVGLPVKAFEANVQVVAQCQCCPECKPFLIPTVNAICTCKFCGKSYTITSVTYDGLKDVPLRAVVGHVMVQQKQGAPS